MKTLLNPEERILAAAVGGLGFDNPFLPARIEHERRALGESFQDGGPVWSVDSARLGDNPNVVEIGRRAEALAEVFGERIGVATRVAEADLQLYEELVLYVLYYRYEDRFQRAILDEVAGGGGTRKMVFYTDFREEAEQLLGPLRSHRGRPTDTAFLFALFFQVRRAFEFTFKEILGSSMAAARLRATVWQSLFTHDRRRYRQGLYDRMHEISTLITGPSGTGKDLVAEAIGRSAFIPFDGGSQRFAEDFNSLYLALDLSALTPTLIESELFGHRRGSFTGAVADRKGFLEGRGPAHTVFLDEIGELDPAIQVKLLRVLQTREFRRIGDTTARVFGGKIIAATNRDLGEEIRTGRFREDLYYRLCADVIETPTLAEQVREDPEELRNLVLLLSTRLIGEEHSTEVAEEAMQWIESDLGFDYPWPGNVRELEQCVRNVLVRGSYRPLAGRLDGHDPVDNLLDRVRDGRLTAEELMSGYCTLVYARCGSYEGAARQLQLDRRTVKSKVDPELLAEFRESPPSKESA